MRLLLLCLFVSFFTSETFSQTTDVSSESNPFIKNRLEFRHDNDFLLFTDRYYTTGSFIGYRRQKINPACEDCTIQTSIELQHVFYTPTDREAQDIALLDRPYAGFLGISSGYTVIGKNNLINLTLLMGVSGKSSGAEGFQNLFHSSGGIGRTVAWIGQIENSFHVNLFTKYVKEWQLLPNPFSVHISYSPEIALGTKDIFLKQQAQFFFGRRNALINSSAYNQMGTLKNELFFGLHVSHSFVGHNALLEGNLVGDNSPYTIQPKDKLFQFGFDIYHRRGKNDFKVGYTYETPATRTVVLHIFMGFSYARNF